LHRRAFASSSSPLSLREIFHATSDEVLPFVRELGVANFASGLVALLSL
jgi:hypothetical protein